MTLWKSNFYQPTTIPNHLYQKLYQKHQLLSFQASVLSRTRMSKYEFKPQSNVSAEIQTHIQTLQRLHATTRYAFQVYKHDYKALSGPAEARS